MTRVELTEKEIEVLNVYVNDCFVDDYGWDSESASMWSNGIGEDVSFDATQVSGVISSLCKKGILFQNGTTGRDATISLTSEGIELVATRDDIKTPYERDEYEHNSVYGKNTNK